jgi:hypothetical protein
MAKREASLENRLVAANQLLDEAEKLIKAQEREVARMKAASLNAQRAENLLKAYRLSLRLAAQDKADIEDAITRERKFTHAIRGQRRGDE